MSVHENKKLVADFFVQVFNEGNLSVVDDFIDSAYTYNGVPASPGGTKEWAASLRKAIPDLHFTIEDLVGEGDKVAIRWTLVGTDAASKQRVTTSATNVITVSRHRATSNWQNGGTSLRPVDTKATP